MADRPHIVIVAKGGANWLGGRQYTINLLEALLKVREKSGEFDVSVLVKDNAELSYYDRYKQSLRTIANIERFLKPHTAGNRITWKIKRTLFNWVNPRLEEPLRQMGATFAYPVSASHVPSADWIPDFQSFHFPNLTSPADVEARKLEFSRIVRNAQRIVVSSRFVEQDCHRIFPQTMGKINVLQFRIFIDPLWINENPLGVVRRYNLPDRFILVSNQFIPTKNHPVIFDALSQVPTNKRHLIHVVCTGDIYDHRNRDHHNKLLNSIHRLGIRDAITITGVIPKHDQIQLLRSAMAYLQPSLYEGWNTGVEEAHMLGKTILLSDIPVHREQSPPKAIFFKPDDSKDLSAKILALAESACAPNYDIAEERLASASYSELQRTFAEAFLKISGVRPPAAVEAGQPSRFG